ncbi:hypothetical protein LTR64_003806 [Lithohypha guttulata]|uniref:uncharacterized protein n=1 Tax=Lithohypha guttulata TaxID=1690604 RepID=UPI002DDF6616|nr:hypothetical protein LTR51_006844 [Lithohypha guttulata]
MAVPETPRRSGRQRKANPRYEDQIEWTEDIVRTLRAESNSPDRSSESSAPESVQKTHDVNFDDNAGPGDLVEHAEVQADAELSNAAESSVATSEEDEREDDLVIRDTHLSPRSAVVRRPKHKEIAREKGLRSRMFPEGSDKLRGAISKTYFDNFGPELQDLFPVLRSRDVWHLDPRDSVLPSRASIEKAVQYEAQGKYLSLKVTQEDDMEQNPRNSAQIARAVTSQNTYQISGSENKVNNEVVLGPWNQSQKYKIEPLKPFDITEAYSKSSVPQLAATRNRPHRGWLVNLGARPHCLAWASIRTDLQYLAVSFRGTKPQRDSTAQHSPRPSSAFIPSPGYHSIIQILKVGADPGQAEEAARLSRDLDKAPQLYHQLHMEWGDVIKFEWLPLLDDAETTHTRSLVILSSDGNIRIVNIELTASTIQYIEKPHLIAEPPTGTIFTCFCTPSPIDLIAGDTIGKIHLFVIDNSSSTSLTAYTTIHIHHTYIMSLTTVTDHPTFLASQSAAGEIILTDLRAPSQDRVVTRKARLPTRNLAYYPFARSFLTTSDTSGNSEPSGTSLSTVVSHSMRHFNQYNTLLKLPECSGICTSLAVSPFHPIVLVANASGSVFASNCLKRMLPISHFAKGEKILSWMVKIWEVEWRELEVEDGHAVKEVSTMELDNPAATDNSCDLDKRQDTSTLNGSDLAAPTQDYGPQDNPATEPIDIFYGRPTRRGLTRFYEGFQPDKVDLGPKAHSTTGATSQIILPEEQAVTAMCWNPNPRFSGWAAVGWGSGLLVVRDLSHDVA